MTLDFDFTDIRIIEFGVGLDESDSRTYSGIAVDGNIQSALKEMAHSTWDNLQSRVDDASQFEVSEKYGAVEYVFVPLTSDLAEGLKQLHQANNIDLDNSTLAEPSHLFCYFARMTDRQGRRLTAVRRASQFKGVLKCRLIRLVSDALTIIEDNVFKLDNDFDLLIDSANIHILRPTGFEFVCQLQDAICEAVPDNVAAIQADLRFVDFSSIQEYASQHTRAARFLASIRSQDLQNINAAYLKRQCKNTSVEVRTVNGMLTVDDKHVMGFLEVLDRRRYHVTLIKKSPERFRAASRRRLNG